MKEIHELIPEAVREYEAGEVLVDQAVMEEIAFHHLRDQDVESTTEEARRQAKRMAKAIWEYRYDPALAECRTPMQVFQKWRSRWGGRETGPVPELLEPNRAYLDSVNELDRDRVLRHLWMTRPELFDVSPEARLLSCQKAAAVPEIFLGARLEQFGKQTAAQARRLSVHPAGAVIAGPNRVGKSHLAAAMLADLILTGKTQSCVWANVPELLLRIQATFDSRESSVESVIDGLRKPWVLVMDDLGAEKGTEWAWSTIYVIVNSRLERGLPTWVTTNLTFSALERDSGRVGSRLRSFGRLAIAERGRRDSDAEAGQEGLFRGP